MNAFIMPFVNIYYGKKRDLPGIISDIPPHGIKNRGSDQAVFDNKWVKVRPREFKYISHDGSASAREVVS